MRVDTVVRLREHPGGLRQSLPVVLDVRSRYACAAVSAASLSAGPSLAEPSVSGNRPGTPLVACLVAFSVLLLGLSGCSDVEDVSGLWQTPLAVAPVSGGTVTNDVPVRFRLAVGQYGKDVSGVLLMYSDDHFHDVEACHYLEKAEVKDGHLLFSVFEGSQELLAGDLLLGDYEGDEALEGLLTGPDPPIPVLLVRAGDNDNVHEEGLDMGCP
ncbi:MAG: hypothetical protein FJ109_07570 [Deltaproteobacteria bacterium]|nr:hypothetical protein [Deltaproteobacteria bacterium]